MLWFMSWLWASPWAPNEGEEAKALLDLHADEKWVELTPKARVYLKKNPKSLTGHYVFARALWLGHGEHARAMHHMEKAEEVYKDDYEDNPDPPWKLFSKLLFSMQSIAGDMGDNELELKLIDKYNDQQRRFHKRFDDSYYQLIGERGWPLMKLERYEEARLAAKAAIATERTWQESLGYNVLCAVEAEEGNRQAAQDNCVAALEHARDEFAGIAIDASNAANASFSVLDFESVERYAIEGTEAGGRTHPAWMNLVDLYLLQGKGGAVISAMQGLWQSYRGEELHLKSQHKADIDALFSTILLFAGEGEKALETINSALRAPDRRGSISTSKEQTLAGHMALRYSIRKMNHERNREKASAKGVLGYVDRITELLLPDPALHGDASAVRSVLSDHARLRYTFRLYQDRGLVDVLPCMMGDIIEILGPGVSKVTLDEVRAAESFAGMNAYYDSMEADIWYLYGSTSKVIHFANLAKDNLPLEEAILIGRMYGLLGWAEEKKGNLDIAIQHYVEGYNRDPSLFRRMGWSLPTKIQAPSTGFAATIADTLTRSPRFHHNSKGFTLHIEGNEEPVVCLLSPMGAQLFCSPPPSRVQMKLVEKEGADPVEEEVRLSDEEYIFEIVDSFHKTAFGMANGDTGVVDWSSLDGSTTTSRHATQQRLQELIK